MRFYFKRITLTEQRIKAGKRGIALNISHSENGIINQYLYADGSNRPWITGFGCGKEQHQAAASDVESDYKNTI